MRQPLNADRLQAFMKAPGTVAKTPSREEIFRYPELNPAKFREAIVSVGHRATERRQAEERV